MKIIVIGAGKVGYTLAEHLTQEEHDVIVIDKDDEVIERCSGSLDVICLKGNGANAKVLLEAGVDKANIVIASTESDESNMLSCLIAKRLGAQYTIARIRDPEFNESQMLLQNELGIDGLDVCDSDLFQDLPGNPGLLIRFIDYFYVYVIHYSFHLHIY